MPPLGKVNPKIVQDMIDAALPWTIFINVTHTPKSQTNWNTLQLNGSWANFSGKSSSGQQNAHMAWDVVLAAGTWNIELIHTTYSDRGVCSIQFDGVEKGTIDFYADPGQNNNLSSITDIIVPTTKKIELKIKMTTKNPSSSSFTGALYGLKLIRTA